ncbi:MAG TPA: adenosylcobinamide-phosphate synthase CbiB [Azospira sp.]|nr:adenosylcobinamide-phosphate synthase CbiB [Azospira sp.]
MLSWFALPLAALLGVGLDRLLGEPRRGHPLVAFGRWANLLEKALRPPPAAASRAALRGFGLLAWCCAVLPLALLGAWAASTPWLGLLAHAGLLYFALGARSLKEHADAVAVPLAGGDLATARQKVGYMVSRDTSALDEPGVAKACVESVLENGNDAIFGTLFWFALLGGPGALLFRLANTLDAMWGYKNERFLHFGWAAARLDDLLNWLPARLTALTYAWLGNTRQALDCWKAQAPTWESPNAGPVMAAGAGSLGVLLGGAAIYHGQEELRPPLGAGRPAAAFDIDRASSLVQRGVAIWLAVIVVTHPLLALVAGLIGKAFHA